MLWNMNVVVAKAIIWSVNHHHRFFPYQMAGRSHTVGRIENGMKMTEKERKWKIAHWHSSINTLRLAMVCCDFIEYLERESNLYYTYYIFSGFFLFKLYFEKCVALVAFNFNQLRLFCFCFYPNSNRSSIDHTQIMYALLHTLKHSKSSEKFTHSQVQLISLSR